MCIFKNKNARLGIFIFKVQSSPRRPLGYGAQAKYKVQLMNNWTNCPTGCAGPPPSFYPAGRKDGECPDVDYSAITEP